MTRSACTSVQQRGELVRRAQQHARHRPPRCRRALAQATPLRAAQAARASAPSTMLVVLPLRACHAAKACSAAIALPCNSASRAAPAALLPAVVEPVVTLQLLVARRPCSLSDVTASLVSRSVFGAAIAGAVAVVFTVRVRLRRQRVALLVAGLEQDASTAAKAGAAHDSVKLNHAAPASALIGESPRGVAAAQRTGWRAAAQRARAAPAGLCAR